MPWFDDPKHPLRSRTVWGGLVVVLLGLLQLFDVVVDVDPATVTEVAVGAVNTVAGAVTIYGRIMAKRPVKL